MLVLPDQEDLLESMASLAMKGKWANLVLQDCKESLENQVRTKTLRVYIVE